MLLGYSCENSGQSFRTGDIEMRLVVQPRMASSTSPATIHVEAINAGTRVRTRTDGCVFWDFVMSMEILAPDSQRVYLWNPTVRPECPTHLVPFRPGDRVEGTAEFNGSLYGEDSSPIVARTGEYQIKVTFTISSDEQMSTSESIERTATIAWNDNH
jgi:hypothetical protein